MEKRVMKIFSVILGGIMVLCAVLLVGIEDIHSKSEVLAKEMHDAKQYKETIANRMQDEIANAEELKSFADKGQIRIAIPSGVNTEKIQFNEDVMTRFYQIVIPNAGENYFDSNPIMGSVGNIDDFSAYTDDGAAFFEITLNGIYDTKTTVENGFLYLDFRNPHDVYDSVIVIDAGHGGRDVGAVEGNVYEKNIDLDIVKQLKAIIDADPSMKAYYTRLGDTNPSLEERVKLANDVNADVFLSVHNNSLSGFDARKTSGTQVLYYANDATQLSERFATICLDTLCAQLESTNRGLVNGNDIYIIHNSKSPVALVEIGFLSNPDDLKKLQDSGYQRRCAQALYDSVKEMINSFKE
ncbi:MAG: N-acetylmuramoyl-L-alanine amidase [Lachnospiraceae bacterium]|nr:N-acetylmuramoyl-L-alanine amidase [Lachnospiraceae bacterium]